MQKMQEIMTLIMFNLPLAMFLVVFLMGFIAMALLLIKALRLEKEARQGRKEISQIIDQLRKVESLENLIKLKIKLLKIKLLKIKQS